MSKFGWFIVALIAVAAVLFLALAAYNESATGKILAQGRAEAMVITAQGQSRLDSAQAGATLMSAALPLVGLALVGLYGILGVAALIAMMVYFNARKQPPRIIERQVVLLPAPGLSRREVWRALSGDRTDVPLLVIDSREKTETP